MLFFRVYVYLPEDKSICRAAAHVFFQETHGRQHGDASVLQLHGTPLL
jgi:hypothetical protein